MYKCINTHNKATNWFIFYLALGTTKSYLFFYSSHTHMSQLNMCACKLYFYDFFLLWMALFPFDELKIQISQIHSIDFSNDFDCAIFF